MKRPLFAFFLILVSATTARAQLPAAFAKPVPETVADLQAIEDHVQQIVAKVTPAVVCVRIGNTLGSGVIVDREGRILTAAHVSGEAGREATVIFPDGRRARAKTLGANINIDSGMLILTERVDFIYASMAKSADVKRGDWCLTLGHPGGYKLNRPPVVRLGRVQAKDAKAIITDCALVGGDSGGPLVDMKARIIGINSRIGGKVSLNVHVPIDTYQETWGRLASGDVWGKSNSLVDPFKQAQPYLGLRASEDQGTVKIDSITPGSPAEKAGLKVNDLIVRLDDRAINGIDEFSTYLQSKRPGAEIRIFAQRGERAVFATVTLGKRPN